MPEHRARVEHDTTEILRSLAGNLAIAIGKAIVAAISGSGSLLAETLHSFADCGNQLLLLFGVKRAARPPDDRHPLGHGRDVYFWSFMVALLLFSAGGMFSLHEGYEKLRHRDTVEHVRLGLAVLGFSFLLEGWALVGNVREMNRRRGQVRFFRYLRVAKDSDLIVVFGENAAAVTGLTLAAAALGMAGATGDSRWDAAGSIAIGAVLVAVALFLAIEIKSLLVGEAADPVIARDARQVVADDPRLAEVLRLITLQQGPGEVLLAIKIRFEPHLTAVEVSRAINDFEAAIRAHHPTVRWIFVEPDHPA